MAEVGFFVQQNNHVTENINQSQGPAFYLKAASIAEELGYDSFWLPDHWLLSNNKAAFDCWSVLAAVAATTATIKIGSLVTPVTAHSPFLLAKHASTVQMISAGRLQFGVGAGWHREEYVAAGLPFNSHRVRLEQLEEAIRFLQLLWKAETPFDFNGRHYTASQALLRPHAEHPPLWLGGSSDRLLKLVGTYADGWIPFEVTQQSLAGRMNYLHHTLDQTGRKTSQVKIGFATRVVAAKTSQEAIELSSGLGISRDYVAPDLPKGIAGHMVVGSFEECAVELGGLLDTGVQHLILSPQPPDRTHELLSVYQDQITKKMK